MEKKPSIMTWLLASCLSAGLLPDFVMTICAAKTEKALSAGLSSGIGFAAVCISLLFFMRAAYIRFGKEPADAEKADAEKADAESANADKKADKFLYLLGFFPCLLVYLVVLYGSNPVMPVLAAGYAAKKGLFIGITAVLAVVMLLVLGISFFCWMNGCRRESLEHPVRRFLSRIYLGLPMAALLWAAVLAVPSGQVLIRSLWEEPGVLIRHLALMAGSFVMAAFLNAAMALTGKMMAGAGTVSAADRQVLPQKYMPFLVSLFLCLFLFVSQNMPQLMGNEAAMLNAQLKDSLIEYGFYLAASDIGGAAGIAEEAVQQMDSALSAAADAEKEAAQDAAVFRKAERKTKALQKVCDKYEIFRSDGQALALLEKYKRYGGADAELTEAALSLSEEYPENLWVQYTAAMLGSSLTYDKAGHYDRTAKAILRCEELYRKEKKPTDAERAAFGKSMAQMLLKVYHEEEAAGLLEELMEQGSGDDAELYQLLVQCYDRTDRLEEAYKLAAAYCEKQEDSPYLMYYAALSALKLEKRKECLMYTSRFATYTAGCDGEELKNCDTWLFGLLEFLTLSDNSKYTGFQYDVYGELTEEENAFIDTNPFFRNYLDAVYLAYHSNHEEEFEEALVKMEPVLSENPKLASAWYLCGVIASNTGEQEYQEDAIKFYSRAGELNDEIPAVWYAMAREYDRMGEYEKGIEACKKALSLLPEQDHGNDWYGISYHCSRLLQSLQAAVK